MKLALLLLLPALASASDSFLWGVANSAFQVEGSPADSNWYRWTHSDGRIEDGTNADVATDFWNRYDSDFALAEELGANAFRISLAWDRINPERGRFDESALAHYERMIVAMRARGIEPVVTLLHSVLPVWVAEKGGTLARGFDRMFADYAVHVISRLGAGPAHVKYWLTFNEPTTYAEGAYITGSDPPGKRMRFASFMRCVKAQAKAHIRAVKEVRKLGLGVLMSAAQDWQIFQAKNPSQRVDAWLANIPARVYDRAFLDPAFKAGTLDFMGFNYYSRLVLDVNFIPPFVHPQPPVGPLSDTGMEVYPEGLFLAIEEVYSRYKLPIMITENGLSDANDRLRGDFLREHVAALMRAKESGIPILGYLHWSLTDNFEWSSGHGPRYGLVEIDYTTLARRPRSSYFVYQDLIRQYSQ